MKFIHVSDIHLGCSPDIAYPWGSKRGEEIWQTFTALIQECRSKKVNLLLISGDLFDHEPSIEELKRANKIMAKARQTYIVFIAGDSDRKAADKLYQNFEWAGNICFLSGDIADSVYLSAIDTAVYGLTFSKGEEVKPLEAADFTEDGGIKILLAYSSDVSQLPIEKQLIEAASLDYVALGGDHKAQQIRNSDRAAWAGSLEPLSKQEIGKHGYMIGTIENGRRTFMFVPFSLREYVSISVAVSSDVAWEELKSKLKGLIEKTGEQNIYRITLEGKYQPKQPFDKREIQKLGNVIAVEDKTVPDYNIKVLLENHKDDVVGMYMEELLKMPSSPARQRALYLGLDALLFQEEPN